MLHAAPSQKSVRYLGIFFKLGRQHSSLDHLLDKELINALSPESQLLNCLSQHRPGVSRLVNLRNGQEHSATTKGPKLTVSNFQLMPSNEVRQPIWHLDGEEPLSIGAEMADLVPFLTGLAEVTLVGCVVETLPLGGFPYVLENVEDPDPECPVRYRLTLDVSALNLGS